jgi:hypothetical protein
MTRLCLLLLASCAAAQATRPPATSVINDQHTTGGTGPVTSAQAYVRPPAPEKPLPRPLPRAGASAPTDAQLVDAELSQCKHREATLVVARAEPLCAPTNPVPRARHRRARRE